MKIKHVILGSTPYHNRDEMFDEVRFTLPHVKRHSIMDAFRRLKLDGKIEEWCDGTITLPK